MLTIFEKFFRFLIVLPIPNSLWALVISVPFFLVSRTHIRWVTELRLFRVRTGSSEIFIARRSRLTHYFLGVEYHLRRLAEQYGLSNVPLREGATAVDVGANAGEFTSLLAQLGLRVTAFEPDPTDFRALESNVPQSRRYSVALWSYETELELYLANDSGDTSLFEPAEGYLGSIRVKTSTLDELLHEEETSERIQILKLEAEGAEPEILLGGISTLKRTEWVLADLGFERGPGGQSTLPEAISILIPLGFTLVDVKPPRLVAVFRNSVLLGEPIWKT